MKIAHAADIHIRSHTYIDEIKYTFERFYESLKEESPNLIYIGGDIYHSKLTVSNEYFEVATDFFRTLGDIAPVIVIPGNHDLSLNNKSRQDAITPIIKAIDGFTKYKVYYSKRTESFTFQFKDYEGLETDFLFSHFSILDKKSKWPTITQIKQKPEWSDKINIALYHGSINGCKVDNGWTSRGNRDGMDIFGGFDFAMLGDIHLHQFMDKEKRVAYPGSIRQNNYGETIDKGYLIWDIKGADDFEVERRILEQKRYFFTLYAESAEDIKDIGDLKQNSRIRVKLTKDVSPSEKLKIKTEVELLYKPVNDVQVSSPEEDIDVGSIKVGNIDVLHENIREPEVQKKLIEAYFEDKNISDDDLKSIHEMDKIYHSHVETDVERNKIYKLGNIKFSNLFSFGENNNINFPVLDGLVGLFGENAIGKSSLMEILSLGIHNKIAKEGVNKNIDYINKRKKKASCQIPLVMNSKDYFIERTLAKKDTKNGEKCINSIDFYEILNKKKISKNGESKPDTNLKIRKKFGTDEDLYFTSFCDQFGLTRFIDARGTKRKESLAKYFDLEVFKIKYDIAKGDYDSLKAKLEEYDYTKIQSEIDSKKLEIESIDRQEIELEDEELLLESRIEEFEADLKRNLSGFIQTSFSESDLEAKKAELTMERDKLSTLEDSVSDLESRIDWSLEGLNLEELRDKLEDSITKRSAQKVSLAEFEQERKSLRKNVELIKEIPNVPQCKVCKLASYAFESEELLSDNRDKYDVLASSIIPEDEITELKEKIKLIVENNSHIEQHKRENLEAERVKESIKYLSGIIKDIESNLEKVRESDKKLGVISNLEDSIKELRLKIRNIISRKMELSSQKAVDKERIKDLSQKLKKCEDLSQKKRIFELYLESMGKNGISYWIISKKMPMLNKQVNLILSQTVNFKLLIEDSEEEKSVKIFIVDEKGKRPVELGSGMEKTMAAIALRASLWNICLLPKTPVLILDEAFSHLDSEKYDGVINLLSYLKKFFDAIIIITHNEDLKTVMDQSYYIKKDSKGMSKCQIG